LDFYDGSKTRFDGLVEPEVSATNGLFEHQTATPYKLSAKTRYIGISLLTYSHQGQYCDGYFDKLSLKLSLT